MDSPDSDWVERELLVFLDRVRPWIFFIGAVIVLLSVAGILRAVFWGLVGDQLLMPLAFFLVLGTPGVFLILAAKKASEALYDRNAVKPTLRMFLGLVRVVGVLCGIQLVGLAFILYTTVMEF